MTIDALLRAAAARYSIPVDLFLRQAKQESGARQFDGKGQIIRSSAGALGVMQLMPATAAELGVDPYDPAENIDGGARYLRRMYDSFGTWPLALAAYNAGPGRMRQVLSGSVALPSETAKYVEAIMGAPLFPSGDGGSKSPPFLKGPAVPPRPGHPKPRRGK